MHLIRLLGGAVLAAALAAPPAHAAGTVSGGPARVAGGYSVAVIATDGSPDRFMIDLERGTAANGESELLTVSRGVRVTVRGGTATIKGSLGSRGTVDLRLRGARADRKRALPEGCTGSRGTSYTGTLEGRLRLRLPTGKWVTIRSLRGSIYVGGKLRCDGGDDARGDGGDGDGAGDGGEPQLMLSTQVDGGSLVFRATKRMLELTRIGAERRERGATVSTMSSLRASGSNLLTVSGGGAQATVKAAGAFTGSGAFTATTSGGPTAIGTLGGSLAVKPRGGSAVSIAGEPAMLLNADKG